MQAPEDSHGTEKKTHDAEKRHLHDVPTNGWAIIDAAAPYVTHDSMITDGHFLAFEGIPELHELYESPLLVMGKYALNPLIGMMVREKYNLSNKGRVKATSTLAGTVMRH